MGRNRTRFDRVNLQNGRDHAQTMSILDPDRTRSSIPCTCLWSCWASLDQNRTQFDRGSRTQSISTWSLIESLFKPYQSPIESLGPILFITVQVLHQSPYRSHIVSPLDRCPIVDRVLWPSSDRVSSLSRIPPMMCRESSQSLVDCVSSVHRLSINRVSRLSRYNPIDVSRYCSAVGCRRYWSCIADCPDHVSQTVPIMYRVLARSCVVDCTDHVSSTITIVCRDYLNHHSIVGRGFARPLPNPYRVTVRFIWFWIKFSRSL